MCPVVFGFKAHPLKDQASGLETQTVGATSCGNGNIIICGLSGRPKVWHPAELHDNSSPKKNMSTNFNTEKKKPVEVVHGVVHLQFSAAR